MLNQITKKVGVFFGILSQGVSIRAMYLLHNPVWVYDIPLSTKIPKIIYSSYAHVYSQFAESHDAAGNSSQLFGISINFLIRYISAPLSQFLFAYIIYKYITGQLPYRPYLGCHVKECWGGMKIISVNTDSPAAKSKLEVGDIIKEIFGIAVKSIEEFKRLLLIYSLSKTRRVLLTIERNREIMRKRIILDVN